MPTSAPGSNASRAQRARGFTLIEVMVVMAIVAIGAGLISLAIRDPSQTRLEQDAARLASLLETARTEARAGGLPVVWIPGTGSDGASFRFVGLPATIQLPNHWLDEAVNAQVEGASVVTLGPDAILAPQRVLLRLDDRQLEVGTDGIAAFAIVAPAGGG